MAEKKTRASKTDTAPAPRPLWRRGLTWIGRGLAGLAAFYLLLIFLFSFLPPPGNIYQWQESWRLGGIKRTWVSWDKISPDMGRSAAAGEDANFCLHWGFDIAQIRDAIARGKHARLACAEQRGGDDDFSDDEGRHS